MLQRGAQDAQTPRWLWDLLEETFGPVWDPCPHNPTFDGLSVDWLAHARKEAKRQAYLNPEYKHIRVWLEKALYELKRGMPSIFLIPFRPQTEYFAELVLPYASEIRILSDFVTFQGFSRPFPQRMCIIVFGRPVRWHRNQLQATRPLYVDRSVLGQTVEETITQYSRARGSRPIDAEPVPLTKAPMHVWAKRRVAKWLYILEQRPNTDIYSFLSDTSGTFMRALVSPAVQAVIFWPRLPMAGYTRPSQYCAYAVWGKPKPTAKQLADMQPLPPTFVWDIMSHTRSN